MKLASRLSIVKPSPSMAAKARVDALRAQGHSIVDLTVGEPDFPTPAHIIEGGARALYEGHTRYTASAGTPELRAAIAGKLARENGLSYEPDEIVVGCGAKHIIFNAFAATLDAGDEVIIPSPYWVSYPDMAAINGGKPVCVGCREENGFKLIDADLRAAITPHTRWLVLNTPNNPSGAVYSAAELTAICKVLIQNPHVWVLTDEIYEHFAYDSARHQSMLGVSVDLKSRTLVVNGLSKAYAFTGWRIGYGAGPRELVRAIDLLLTQSTTCANAMSQVAATIALNGPQECIATAASLFQARRNAMVELLNAIPGLKCPSPQGAFYVFLNVKPLLGQRTPAGRELLSDTDVMMYLLESAGVAVVDGASYGAPGHLRLSFATSMEKIHLGCESIAKAVGHLEC